MKKLASAGIAFSLLFLLGPAASSKPAGKFFGDDVERFEATGFFRIEKKSQVPPSGGMPAPLTGVSAPQTRVSAPLEAEDEFWWLVTPDGYAFYSMGINHITAEGYYSPKLGYSPYEKSILKSYGAKEKWAETTRNRLREWGFNTIGAWSNSELFPEFPYVLQLNFASLGGGDWLKGTFPDVFDPEWEQKVFLEAERICGQRKNDPWLIGYFTDNELRFGPDWRGPEDLLELFFQLPAQAPGKKQLIQFFQQRYNGDFSGFEKVWKSGAGNFEALLKQEKLDRAGKGDGKRIREDVSAFKGMVAERYFSITAKAVREADPNHLILGCRFHALGAGPEIIKAAGKWMDVVSINYYYLTPAQNLLPRLVGSVDFSGWMKKYHELSGKPILITEFSYRAITSGLPNTKGAPVTVFSQYDRAGRFSKYARNCQSAGYIIGYHWFNYMDEPKEGRFDGENSNYGIVDKDDRPYQILVEKMSESNLNAYQARLKPD